MLIRLLDRLLGLDSEPRPDTAREIAALNTSVRDLERAVQGLRRELARQGCTVSRAGLALGPAAVTGAAGPDEASSLPAETPPRSGLGALSGRAR